jgi:hypothetical protein
MWFMTAREILNKHCRALTGKEASTNKRAHSVPDVDAVEISWWFENSGASPRWDNERTVAYLCAYVEIAGRRFPMTGIELEDGYIHPDRAVTRSLLQAECISTDDGDFVLTDKGRALIAPMVKLED